MKYSPEIVDEICHHIELGVSNKDACQLADISEETLYKWIKEKPEFSERIKKAVSKRKQRLTALILKAGEKTWQAAAWYLERVHNKEFAKREIREHEFNPEEMLSELFNKIDDKCETKDTSPVSQ